MSRVGDFYEAYGDDARELAAALNIVCTSKESGKGTRTAMAGVPHHSVDHYLGKLLRQRRVLAIAEQMEEPVPNRLVRRDIVRVLTPGTVLEDQFLDAGRNNFLCAITKVAGITAIAAADVSTSTAQLCILEDEESLASELDRLAPAELVTQSDEDATQLRTLVSDSCRIAVLDPHDPDGPDPPVLAQLAFAERSAAREALALLERYLRSLRLDGRSVVDGASLHETRLTMTLDRATRKHLDLLTGSGESSVASLFSVINKTKTSMGSRLLARWLCAPLLEIEAIRERHDRIAALVATPTSRMELQHELASVGDIERLCQKIHARRAGPRDLVGLRRSLEHVARVADRLRARGSPLFGGFAEAIHAEGIPGAVAGEIAGAVLDEPSATLLEGGVIRPQHNAELLDLVNLRTSGREQLLALETEVRAQTSIRSLKIKYTQAFGYYYEVPRSQSEAVPPSFARRQSLVNAERFSDPRLKELETKLLTGRSAQVALERRLFDVLLERVDAYRPALLGCARAVAQLDVTCSLAQVASERRYSRPTIVGGSSLAIESGRHPIVESYGGLDYVPNDTSADAQSRFLLITGPNMGGKSTYLRQTALIAILAQMGSFVPAERAQLGIVDRLFTRIGAGDDIAAGRSTFYVEMAEMALILRHCTPRSLLLIDEVGRGTGTIDGLAIAQAASEHLLELSDAMPIVLFATHFHELVDLAKTYPALTNLHVAVADEPGGPVFSHRLLPGSSSRSYGIAVAKMAGMPKSVVQRAQEIAAELERRPALRTRQKKAVNPETNGREQLEML